MRRSIRRTAGYGLPPPRRVANFPGMGVFEFIVILVLISTLGKAAIAISGPLADHLGDLLREMAAEKRARREALQSGQPVSVEVVEELELRLARIEDRLAFLEELKRPDRRSSLTSGSVGGDAGRGTDRG